MSREEEIRRLDLKHVWHPCSQMKDYEAFPPVVVERASGPCLYVDGGRPIIDAISSWWCKSLGHGHPVVREAFIRQVEKFEHVIGANTCNAVLTELASELAGIFPGLTRSFFSENGSTAIEIALKMALQYQKQSGATRRTRFAALRHGYHGETMLNLSVSDCDLYANPFVEYLSPCVKLGPIPIVVGKDDPEWLNPSPVIWQGLENQLTPYAETLSAIIIEPILQGAGGMRLYAPKILQQLRAWTAARRILLIADEVMTGFGRTGEMAGCDHAGIIPDLACFSKGLTSGFAPMAVTVVSETVYQAFYDDYERGKAFLHSNTFSGYAPAAAAALAVFKVFREERIIERVRRDGSGLGARLNAVAQATGALRNVRGLGFMAAADLIDPATGEPFPTSVRAGYQVYRHAVELGAWLRPLGDTIYFLPPLNTPEPVLDRLAEIAQSAIEVFLARR